MSGPELVRQVTAIHPAVRIILMSGDTIDGAALDPALRRDVVLLAKPFVPADLVRLVGEVLSGASPRAAPLSLPAGDVDHTQL